MAHKTHYQQTEQWYRSQGWRLFEFQKQAWQAWHNGESGLIHSPTGSGKTLAAWLGPVQHAAANPNSARGLQLLWITPLRALANDTCEQLLNAAQAHDTDIKVETRTGDTNQSRRQKQLSNPPFALITTPESLSVMLSYKAGAKTLKNVTTVVVDEWHELLGSKRGVQLQLCLARLKQHQANLKIWGLSATISNLDEAIQALIGTSNATLIQGVTPKSVIVDSVLPNNPQHFRWSGHLGTVLVNEVAEVISQANTTLVFTNTRSQAEIWFQALLSHKPEWLFIMALHHGSIDRKLRQQIEQRLRMGEMHCVVCTSSLDLGVDFSPVDQVIQIGSPKGVARLMQRAGRSGHQPGAVSRVVCVPTHAFELVEIAAVRNALEKGRIEARTSPLRCLDVLCQHLVTIAMGSGFDASDMLAEVRSTYAFKDITDHEWNWALDFISRGGQALKGYPQFRKVVCTSNYYHVVDRTIASRHRMGIGTINSDAQINVAFQRGKRLGSTEESFIARLKPGDTFQFSGRNLELLRVKDMTAFVKVAKRKSGTVPRWWGTHLPISSELADSVLETLEAWRNNITTANEISAVADMLKLQQSWSILPGPNDFLLELISVRQGNKRTQSHSLFCFPFAGRLAHEGLAMLLAYRLSQQQSITLTLQINDYGFELCCPQPIQVDLDYLMPLFSTENLVDDILESINSGEIAKRQFRDIARIAGLVFSGFPGRAKSTRQVQATSGLLYDVFEKYDQENLLLYQAKREVLDKQLEIKRVKRCLESLQQRQWHLQRPDRLTPLSFPLWAESLQSQTYSSESFTTRVNRMLGSLEQAAVKTLGKQAAHDLTDK